MSKARLVVGGGCLVLLAMWVAGLLAEDGAPDRGSHDPRRAGPPRASRQRGDVGRADRRDGGVDRVPVAVVEAPAATGPASTEQPAAPTPPIAVFLDVYAADASREPPVSVQEVLLLLEASSVGLTVRVRRADRGLARMRVRHERWAEYSEGLGEKVGSLWLPAIHDGDVAELLWGSATITSQRLPADADRVAFRVEVATLFARAASLEGRLAAGRGPDGFDVMLAGAHGRRAIHVAPDGHVRHARLLAPGDYELVGCRPVLTDVRREVRPRTMVLPPRQVRLEAGRTHDLGVIESVASVYLEGFVAAPDGRDPEVDYTVLELWSGVAPGTAMLLHRFEVPTDAAFRVEGLVPRVYLVCARHGGPADPPPEGGALRVDLRQSDLHSLRVTSRSW